MKKSHILLAAWGASLAIILAMPQLRSLVRFSINEAVSPTRDYDRMAMSTKDAVTSEDKFVGAIHFTRLSTTSFSESSHSNLSELYQYCKAFPQDIEAAGIYCRRAMRQSYADPARPKQTNKNWLERSKNERLELLSIAQTAEKQNPQNWLWRLAQGYVYMHDSNEAALAQTLTKQPLPTTYTDYAFAEASRLEKYYRGTFWGITPVQSASAHASIVFPNFTRIAELFDSKFRTISLPEKLAGARCALDMGGQSEFFIGSMVARNMALRLVDRPRNSKKSLAETDFKALLDKATWISQMPKEDQEPFRRIVSTQPNFVFDDDITAMMLATHTHIPLMMGLGMGCLALLSIVPWRPKLKYPVLTPIIVALSALPLSMILGMNRGIWGEQNSFIAGFIDFNSAQKFMANLTMYLVIMAMAFSLYRLVSQWKQKNTRWESAAALVVLLFALGSSPVQFSLVLFGCLLATWDSEKQIQPGVAALLCGLAFGLEYSLHPQQSQSYLAVVPAALALIASPRTRGTTQLGWLGLALVFVSFFVQRFTIPSLTVWLDNEKTQLAEYRTKLGIESRNRP